ncbi:kinesin-like protein KIN-UA [Humulus lupulus]|uniref:kinesin-like protein KIN-UA n=1 Tax=Humulus lupulus TaxID=3486 RepID=UPI002B40BF07|nr:kinesin-like protein KIN-UA [Humulus lupulus]
MTSRLKLDSNTFELIEFESQICVYEVMEKPIVQSVLDGYNGIVMAYRQTGTSKTYSLGRQEGTAARGIMVCAMEDILADISLETDSVSVSYLQLYMETIQDLLDPANDNISIVEDPKTGDVSLPGATIIENWDHMSFVELLRLGEAHRFAANTKLNTESSRSQAILMVNVKRHVKGRDSTLLNENGNISHISKILKAPLVWKGKLVIVDLAGSERIDNDKIANEAIDNGTDVTSNKENLSALEEVVELKKMLQKETLLRKNAEEEINILKYQLSQWIRISILGTIEASDDHSVYKKKGKHWQNSGKMTKISRVGSVSNDAGGTSKRNIAEFEVKLRNFEGNTQARADMSEQSESETELDATEQQLDLSGYQLQTNTPEPNSVGEALSGKNNAEWSQAM